MRVARNKRPEIGEDGQVIRAQSGSRAGLTLIFAALITFVYIGGSVGTQLVKQYFGQGATTDQAMVSALLLNIALILLIWRRTSVLSEEVDVYRQAEVRAQHLAITDPLTNLFNRRAIKEKTADLTARASRRGKSVAFMMIDLDGFKPAFPKWRGV